MRPSSPANSATPRTWTRRALAPFEEWTTREIVIGAVLAVVAWVIFWAWDALYSSVFQAIPFPAVYAINGMWMLGGLLVPYVIRRPGAAFFGESMFHVETDASKVALHALIERLRKQHFTLLDIQWVTPHLATFGAIEISRRRYLKELQSAIRCSASFL